MDTVSVSALQGLARAQDDVNRVARRIANPNYVDKVSLSDDAVALLEAGHAFQSNTAALRTQDEMERSLLGLL